MNLVFVTRLPVPSDEAFAWHERPGAFERLAPPWQRTRVLARSGTIHDGDRLRFRTGLYRWEAVHEGYRQGREFTDRQVRGPFRSWIHTHSFRNDGDGAVLEDRIDYQLPLGALGRALAGGAVERQIRRLFAHRQRRLVRDLARHSGRPKLRIAVSGASGLVGSELVAFLTSGGHEVLRLVRRAAGPGEIAWDPARGTIDAGALEGLDAVIHLAGANVAARWTRAHRRRIRDSRVEGTRLLASALAGLRRPPRVFVSASAIGIYGLDGEVDERSPAGADFLARVCVDWEGAAAPARARGIRVVHPRLGVVLSPRGGALAKLLTPFRLGLGGPVGSGRQPMSWVAIDDVIGALHHCLFDEALDGPVNVVAPAPVTNAELARTLGQVLGRPAFLRLPAFAVRLLFGEMGDTMLLHGARVAPRRLAERGFHFEAPELSGALDEMLGEDHVRGIRESVDAGGLRTRAEGERAAAPPGGGDARGAVP